MTPVLRARGLVEDYGPVRTLRDRAGRQVVPRFAEPVSPAE